MKSLIKPFFAASFLLMASGLVPGVPILMACIGFMAFVAIGMFGIHLLGSQDKEFDSMIQLMRLEVLKAKEVEGSIARQNVDFLKKHEEMENRVSKAISELRSESARLR